MQGSLTDQQVEKILRDISDHTFEDAHEGIIGHTIIEFAARGYLGSLYNEFEFERPGGDCVTVKWYYHHQSQHDFITLTTSERSSLGNEGFVVDSSLSDNEILPVLREYAADFLAIDISELITN